MEKVDAHKLGTRERLLAAAEKLFADKGYEDTSIREITEAAEANVASIHYHFGGKENLYLEIFRHHAKEMGMLRDRTVLEIPVPAGVPMLEGVIRGLVGGMLRQILFNDELSNFLTLIFREVSNPGPAFELLYREFIQPNHQILQQAIMAAVPEMDERRATFCAISIMGMMHHFVRARRVVPRVLGHPLNADTVEEFCDHIVTFSLKGIGVI